MENVLQAIREFLQPGPPKPELAAVKVNDIWLERFDDFSNPAYKSLSDLLGDCVPSERYDVMNPAIMAQRVFPKDGSPSVLDVGCGSGRSLKMFRDINENVQWKGIEIAETYNIGNLDKLPVGVSIYDGVNIPFPDSSFEFCFSKQVFEHVRYPEPLLAEVLRVLKPGGTFFGGLSGGEPYHWHSLFNFTPLGWKTVLDDNGFDLTELYAGIDSLTLFLHHWAKNRADMGEYFPAPFINMAINEEEKSDPKAINYENTLKLAFAGHIIFRAQKPA